MEAVNVGADLNEEVVWDKDGESGGCAMSALMATVAVAGLIAASTASYILAPHILNLWFR